MPCLSIRPHWRVSTHLSASCVLPACLCHLQHEYAFKVGWRVRFTCHSFTCLLSTRKTRATPRLYRLIGGWLLPNGSRVLAIRQFPKVAAEWRSHSIIAQKISCNFESCTSIFDQFIRTLNFKKIYWKFIWLIDLILSPFNEYLLDNKFKYSQYNINLFILYSISNNAYLYFCMYVYLCAFIICGLAKANSIILSGIMLLKTWLAA